MERLSKTGSGQNEGDSPRWPRRRFLGIAAAGTLSLPIAAELLAGSTRGRSTLKVGLIADLHHDLIPDGFDRLGAFLDRMREWRPDAIVQMGDFAFPNRENQPLVDRFRCSEARVVHVIGNHDLDQGLTREDCCRSWGIEEPYYAVDLPGLRLIVLDGNEKGSPSHRGGYPSYVGSDQVRWLDRQIESSDTPVVLLSHQPLAGTSAVDNAEELQALLTQHSDRVFLAVNGHSHTDDLVRVGGVSYLHLNSASYYWVGGKYSHRSFPEDVHARFPALVNTCPYRDPLYACLEIDLGRGRLTLRGRESRWVGASPAELGVASRDLTPGEEIAPRIRDRLIESPTMEQGRYLGTADSRDGRGSP